MVAIGTGGPTGNLNFVIFNSLTGTLLFQSGATAFVDDGMAFKKSNDFAFTLLAGTRYAMGAVTDVRASFNFIVPGGKTMNGISSLGRNQNADGFIDPLFRANLNGTDGSLQLFTGPMERVSEPATLVLLLGSVLAMGAGRCRR